MRKYICRRDTDVNIPKERCGFIDGNACKTDLDRCDATRYVRADVAMRYARMKERKGYEIAQDYGPHKCIYGADNTIVAGDDDIRWNTYEEAQQAWIKQNRGNVAQREA